MRFSTLLFASLIWIACGENKQRTEKSPNTTEVAPPKLIEEKVDTALSGSWVLNGLPQSPTPFTTLYPRQRPIIFIQPSMKLISGSTGCNRFSATITTLGNLLTIEDLTRSTLVCIGDAEPEFLNALEHSTQYHFRNNDELIWGTDSVNWMIFHRR